MNVSEEDKADLAAGKVDYMAFSYYNSSCITTHEVDATVKGNMMDSIKNPYLDASEWGWQIDPVGFKRALHELYDRYQLPLLVIENGLGAQDTLEADGTIHDPYRVDYMKRHIAAMKEAVEEGVDLMGYTMWSCIDLVSAAAVSCASAMALSMWTPTMTAPAPSNVTARTASGGTKRSSRATARTWAERPGGCPEIYAGFCVST